MKFWRCAWCRYAFKRIRPRWIVAEHYLFCSTHCKELWIFQTCQQHSTDVNLPN